MFTNNSAGRARGGAIYANGKGISIKVKDVAFLNNSAGQRGGAIAAIDVQMATVTTAIFHKNRASQGGAIFFEVTLLLQGLVGGVCCCYPHSSIIKGWMDVKQHVLDFVVLSCCITLEL